MKKVTIYNIAFACLALVGIGALTAFDGSETDEQKIDKAYQVLVDAYNAEQDSLCKVSAMAAAELALQAEMTAATVDVGGEEVQPTPKPTTRKTTKPSSTVAGGTTQPAPQPQPTPTPEPPKSTKASKMSGGTSATTNSKKDKMSGTTKSGESTSTSKKKSKMGGK